MRSICIATIAWFICNLTGCTVGPDYRSPEPVQLSLPEQWHGTLPHEGNLLQLVSWWTSFHDPVLTRLIESAQTNHPSIEKALASVQESRASLRTSQAARFPQLSGRATRTRTAGGGGFGLTGSNVNSGASASSGTISNSTTSSIATNNIGSTGLFTAPISLLSSSLDASWELDLFGKKKRDIEGNKARLKASEARWHDARVTIAAEVAGSYNSLRACEALMHLQEEEWQSYEHTKQLIELKVKAGLSASADFIQAQAASEERASQLENQKGTCKQHINQLIQLSGLPYSTLLSLLVLKTGQLPLAEKAQLKMVPAQLLSQRPDVRAAERTLAAASADIGVSQAQRLPSLTLTGSIGINNYQIQNYSFNTKSWSFGPSLSIPMLDGGASANRVKAARARYEAALADYHLTVLTAVKEVEDTLVRIDTAYQREKRTLLALKHYQNVLDTAHQKYQSGNTSLLDVEDIQRQYLSHAENHISLYQEQTAAWIALYKALGGGWELSADAPATLSSPIYSSARQGSS